VWRWRIYWLVFLAMGYLVLMTLLGPTFAYKFGREVTGRISEVRRPFKKDGQWISSISYTYDGAGAGMGDALMYTSGEHPPRVGDEIAVMVWRMPPVFQNAQARDGVRNSSPMCFFTPVVFILLVVLMVLGWLAWIGPMRQRKLLRRGTAVTGEIAQKVLREEDTSKSYLIWYRFRANDGLIWGGKAKVSREEYDGYAAQQAVVVVYWPGRPKRSVMYEAGDYRVG
jgi:hypothetical protein